MPHPLLETITAGNGPEDESSPLLSLDIEAEFDLIEKTVSKIHMDWSTTRTASTGTGSVKDTEAEHLIELGLERLVTL
jgi:hypothetical protein